MREIKFRAWIKPEERMADVIGLCYESDGKIGVEVTQRGRKMIGSVSDVVYWWKDSEAIVLEYAGVQDENGVDIYEGYIVRYGVSTYVYVTFVDAMFLQTDHEISPDIWYEWDEMQVVGNIYENDDLLTKVI